RPWAPCPANAGCTVSASAAKAAHDDRRDDRRRPSIRAIEEEQWHGQPQPAGGSRQLTIDSATIYKARRSRAGFTTIRRRVLRLNSASGANLREREKPQQISRFGSTAPSRHTHVPQSNIESVARFGSN